MVQRIFPLFLLLVGIPTGAAARPDNATISISGRFASHTTTLATPAPGRPSTHPVEAVIDLHGDTLVYTSGGAAQATRFDRSPAVVTTPARCHDQPTSAERRTTLRAGTTDGKLVVTRYSETSFPSAGLCAGVEETVNELVAVTLAKGRCTFQYTVAHKRSGLDPIDTTVAIVGAPCRATSTPAPRAPVIARGPAEAQPLPPNAAAARPAVATPAPPADTELTCKSAPADATDQMLVMIPRCLPAFCGAGASDQDKASLKQIDDWLIELQLKTADLRDANAQFARRDRTAAHTTSPAGPAAPPPTSYTLLVSFGRLGNLYYALQQAPAEPLIESAMSDMERKHKQPACSAQIHKQVVDLLNAAQAALSRTDTEAAADELVPGVRPAPDDTGPRPLSSWCGNKLCEEE